MLCRGYCRQCLMQLFWRHYWDAVDAQRDIPLTQASLLRRISLVHANNDRTRHRLAILCNSMARCKLDAEVAAAYAKVALVAMKPEPCRVSGCDCMAAW